MKTFTTLARFSVATLLLAFSCAQLLAANWPQFRGPNACAVADGPPPPTFFGPKSNVLWRVNLPPGNSSPIVWGDRIFLTACDKLNLQTLCVDRRDGKILWCQSAPVEKTEPVNKYATPAAPTPVTDGQRVYVYFGSLGLLAYDFEGHEQWRVKLPTPIVEFGTGSSPILADGKLIQLCDQDSGSFLLAVDPASGKTIWRKERPGFRRGFTTPFVWRHDGLEELIVPGSLKLTSYSLADASERWVVTGTARVACSAPACGDGLLFSASWNVGADAADRYQMPPFDEFLREHDLNHDGKLAADEIKVEILKSRFAQIDIDKDGFVTKDEWNSMAEQFAKADNAVLAIRPGGKGDVTASHVAWKVSRCLPYVPSPLYHQGRLYTVKTGGLICCYDAQTGKPFYQEERLGALGDYYASLVAAGDKIFVPSLNGTVVVLQASNQLTILARNNLSDTISATPAIVDGTVYLRTGKGLFAFGKTP